MARGRLTRGEIVQHLQDKAFIEERTFQGQKDPLFWQDAEALGVSQMIKSTARRKEALVKEFYVEAMFQNSLGPTLRGVQVPPVNAETIRQALRLPAVTDCRYTYFLEHPELMPEDEIKDTLCLPGKGWFGNKILRTDMNAHARNWLYFVADYIQPVSHVSDAPAKLSLLVYLLVTRQRVQLEVLILQRLTATITGGLTNLRLPFPHLLTKILTNARVSAPEVGVSPRRFTLLEFDPAAVQHLDLDEMLNPDGQGDQEDEGQQPPPQQAEPQQPQQQEAAPSSGAFSQDFRDWMQRMEDRQLDILQEQRDARQDYQELAARMRSMQQEMHYYFGQEYSSDDD